MLRLSVCLLVYLLEKEIKIYKIANDYSILTFFAASVKADTTGKAPLIHEFFMEKAFFLALRLYLGYTDNHVYF